MTTATSHCPAAGQLVLIDHERMPHAPRIPAEPYAVDPEGRVWRVWGRYDRRADLLADSSDYTLDTLPEGWRKVDPFACRWKRAAHHVTRSLWDAGYRIAGAFDCVPDDLPPSGFFALGGMYTDDTDPKPLLDPYGRPSGEWRPIAEGLEACRQASMLTGGDAMMLAVWWTRADGERRFAMVGRRSPSANVWQKLDVGSFADLREAAKSLR